MASLSPKSSQSLLVSGLPRLLGLPTLKAAFKLLRAVTPYEDFGGLLGLLVAICQIPKAPGNPSNPAAVGRGYRKTGGNAAGNPDNPSNPENEHGLRDFG